MRVLSIVFDILQTSCYAGLTTLETYGWKLRRKSRVLMRQRVGFNSFTRILTRKSTFSQVLAWTIDTAKLSIRNCHCKIHTHKHIMRYKTEVDTDTKQGWKTCVWRHKILGIVPFQIYNSKAWENLQHIFISCFLPVSVLWVEVKIFPCPRSFMHWYLCPEDF